MVRVFGVMRGRGNNVADAASGAVAEERRGRVRAQGRAHVLRRLAAL